MTLEERVRRLEDRAEINDLVVGYFLAADDDDFAGVGCSFTGGATFSASGNLAASGRAAIVDFIRDARTHMGLTVHTPHYIQLTFESEDVAKGVVGAHLELVLANSAVYGAVRYVDRYERVDGSWLIAERDMRTVHIAPWDEVGSAFASTTPVRWPGGDGSASDFPRKS